MKMKQKQTILEMIKQKRKNSWITQEQMANYLKIDYKTYNRKENWITDFTFLEFIHVLYLLDLDIPVMV